MFGYDSTALRTAIVQAINKHDGTGRADRTTGNYVILVGDRKINKFECKLSMACIACYNAAESDGKTAKLYAWDMRARSVIEPAIFEADVEKNQLIMYQQPMEV